jgi:hypothetical protein
MIKWYAEIGALLCEIRCKSTDALEAYEKGGKDEARPINDYLKTDYKRLEELWKKEMILF